MYSANKLWQSKQDSHFETAANSFIPNVKKLF